MSRPSIELNVDAAPGRIVYFRKMVRRSDAPPGTLVDVRDRAGRTVGIGYYNPRSELALRLLRSEDVAKLVRDAADFREKTLRLGEAADAWRVFHAEADGIPGLVIDRYGPVHSVEVYTFGAFRLLEKIAPLLGRVHVSAPADAERIEGFRVPPSPPPEGIVVREHDVRYRIDFATGHKTGFFCDQRENRRALAELARGRSVLDLCTYTGGFALSAARAGATRVVGVDMDEKALDVARQNAKLNHAKVEFRHADLFNYLRQMRETFDVIVLDPPKLARDREELAKAERTYFDMNYLALKALPPGGLLVSCSCSGLVPEETFLGIVRSAAREAGREIAIFRVAGAGPDHPVSSSYPEGRYLKVVFSRTVP